MVLADNTVIQPDLLVARPEDFTEADLPVAPLLAVEVLSPSTRGIDLLLKKDRLERAGCAHYWVVDPDEPSVIAWDLADGAYREVGRAAGTELFEVASPFPVSFTPASLVS
ncbi:MAG: Uma2 family endonuclease [Propionicimonas sp.]|uniref:Uma2 family endonuclease n=1 Tax=Propionicimonas sp. TaxID=1955623 RepID=UPI003D13565D